VHLQTTWFRRGAQHDELLGGPDGRLVILEKTGADPGAVPAVRGITRLIFVG